MVLTSIIGLAGCRDASDPSAWSGKQIDKWFEKGEWLNGWEIKPDTSIDRKALAISYFRHRERWEKAFAFLRDSALSEMELKRYDIDGNNLYAPLSEYMTKNEEEARYEAHRKYIDIQYVVSGKELIGIAPLEMQKDILEPYSEEKDIMFMTVSQVTNLQAGPDRFFIFFPGDLHRPGLKDGESSLVRKVVVKVKID